MREVIRSGRTRWFIGLVIAWAAVASGIKACSDSNEFHKCELCKLRLKMIGSALSAYRKEHGTFPPAFVSDAEGQPTNSWRGLVFRYWAYTVDPSKYDFMKRWNTPENLATGWLQVEPDRFSCPNQYDRKHRTLTSYVAVVGPNTMWPGENSTTPAADGSDDEKILVIEILNSDIESLGPRDLSLGEALDRFNPQHGLGIGSLHRRGINYLTVGGEVRTLDRNINRESLRKLLVRDQEESTDPAR